MKTALRLSRALLLVVLVAAACRAADNPLLGNWAKVDGPDGCATTMKFTATTQTVVNSLGTTSFPVTYTVAPKLVFVVGKEGGDVDDDIQDKDDITFKTAWGDCHFKRN